MRFSHLSVRERLTLQFAGIFLVLLASFALAVFYSVRSTWDEALDRRLAEDLANTRTYLALSPKADPITGHVPGDVHFMAMENGKMVYHSDGWCRDFLKAGFLERAATQGVWRSPGGQSFRLKTTKMVLNGRDLKVTAAESTSEMTDALISLGGVLLTGFLIGLFFAVGTGEFMAGRALAPIGRMVVTAREITADRLSERLPVGNPNDEIGQMATVMNQTLARLETSFTQLTAYTANISHELRTPLTAIRSVGEIALQSSHTPQELREAIGSMLEEADRLARLVECFLTLARAEAGVLPLKLHEIDLADTTRAVVDLLRILADEKRQELKFEAEGPVVVRADAALIRQTLINVVDNAIRYTPHDKGISVTVRERDGQAEVLVRDVGPSIPESERSLVFERFYRREGTSSRPDGGTGLGLAIARWVVEAHHGSIGFIPSGDEGNCCRMALPQQN